MKFIKKILLATDFTNASDSATQMAIEIAKKFESEVLVIHVIPDAHKFKHKLEKIKELTKNNLVKVQTKIKKNNVNVGEIFLVSGSPFDQIVKHADFYDVNLVILGSGEKEKNDHFQLGLTANKVMRKSNKPVWVVKREAAPLIKKVLCPIDFSKASKRALENAIHLAESFKAELSVVTVIQPTERDYGGPSVIPYEEEDTYAKHEELEFEKFLSDFDFYDVKVEREILRGKPDKEILKTISDHNTDLLVIGTIGKSALTRVLTGSVTEKVTREVSCSVITLKSEDAIRVRLEADKENIEECFAEGKKLMEGGFDKEAVIQFKQCLNLDLYFEPAWENLAIAYQRLGKEDEAKNCQREAKEQRQRLWERRVEAEIRSHNTIIGKHGSFK